MGFNRKPPLEMYFRRGFGCVFSRLRDGCRQWCRYLGRPRNFDNPGRLRRDSQWERGRFSRNARSEIRYTLLHCCNQRLACGKQLLIANSNDGGMCRCRGYALILSNFPRFVYSFWLDKMIQPRKGKEKTSPGGCGGEVLTNHV